MAAGKYVQEYIGNIRWHEGRETYVSIVIDGDKEDNVGITDIITATALRATVLTAIVGSTSTSTPSLPQRYYRCCAKKDSTCKFLVQK